MATISFKKNGAVPIIDVIIGQAQLGNYTFALWNSKGKNPRVPASGVADNLDDTFPLAKNKAEFQALNGHTLDGIVWVKSLQTGKKKYSVTVVISQDGVECARWKSAGEMTTSMKNLKKDWTISLI